MMAHCKEYTEIVIMIKILQSSEDRIREQCCTIVDRLYADSMASKSIWIIARMFRKDFHIRISLVN